MKNLGGGCFCDRNSFAILMLCGTTAMMQAVGATVVVGLRGRKYSHCRIIH